MKPTCFASRSLLVRLLPVLIAGTLLSACRVGSGSVAATAAERGDAASTSAPASTESGIVAAAPTPSPQTMIAGSAATTAVAGIAYSFTPTASAPGEVTFSVQNMPAWASFDAETGTISGTPSLANLGSYTNIRISATADGSTASLAAFNITVVGVANGSVSLSWTPPTQNTDGTQISNLAGYRVYYGASPDQLSQRIELSNAGLTTYVISDLGTGTHYFAVTAYTSAGAESDKSNLGTKTI